MTSVQEEFPSGERVLIDTGDPASRPLVELRGVSVRFRQRRSLLSRGHQADIRAVDDVTLRIDKGETLGLVGSTGSGKSTVALVIMGIVQPTAGSVIIDGHDVHGRRHPTHTELEHLVQIVQQDPYSSLDPRMTVGEIIAEPLTLGGLFRGRAGDVRARVSELLSLVGLSPSKANLYPHQFSGGQRQRIAIARALAPRPSIIVLDEPTSALDVSVRAQILNLLKTLQRTLGVTYLVISHDLVTVAYLASTVAVMYLGRIVELGLTKTMYQAPAHPYTKLLLASVPGAGQPPLSSAIGGGASAIVPGTESFCRFVGRCDLYRDLGRPQRCEEDEPTLREAGHHHEVACHFFESQPAENTRRDAEQTEIPGD